MDNREPDREMERLLEWANEQLKTPSKTSYPVYFWLIALIVGISIIVVIIILKRSQTVEENFLSRLNDVSNQTPPV